MVETTADGLILDETFPHRYEMKVLRELPATSGRFHYFTQRDRQRDGLIVSVKPNDGEKWMGMFAFGDMSPKGLSGIICGPRDDQLFVLARGSGYLVDVNHPLRYESVTLDPVLHVVVVKEQRLLVFGDFTDLVAYGSGGVAWESVRLSFDGLKLGKVEDGKLNGQGWSAPDDAWMDFVVDLTNGKHVGGAYNID